MVRAHHGLSGMEYESGFPEFEIAEKGAISADNPKAGQGIWLWFTNSE